MTSMGEPDAAVLASAWFDADPDPETRIQVRAMIEAGGPELVEAFSAPLQFGTAGLRGPLGAGPGAMNRVLVRVVASAISELIETRHPEGDSRVVVGYDARHKSRDFAEDTARVMAKAGMAVTLLPRPLPTPVLAYAVRYLDAAAGVMVTASHNPRTDNGYKVYWQGGAQIVAPTDSDISALISTTHLLGEDDLAPLDHANIEVAAESLIESYLQAAVSLLDPNSERSSRVAYTALHGVGTRTLVSAFEAAGFDAPFVVASQGAPDPDFATTPFPNPEETGVLDGLFALATEVGADVAMANDPDADRLAVAVPHGAAWRLLTGDELGCLLAEHLLSRSDLGRRALVLNTIVSSRLLEQIASNYDARFAKTLTGFKWLMQARGDICDASDYEFVMAYEEALGYCIGGPVWD
ncbi:MAG: phospho-sugar mutase, partial [Actinobacteria bacterium]|nr:phospho-sugar mutase [Actinomycetota bacterium]